MAAAAAREPVPLPAESTSEAVAPLQPSARALPMRRGAMPAPPALPLRPPPSEPLLPVFLPPALPPPPPPPPPTDDAAPGVYEKLRTIARGDEGDMKQYALWAASGLASAALLYGAWRMAQR